VTALAIVYGHLNGRASSEQRIHADHPTDILDVIVSGIAPTGHFRVLASPEHDGLRPKVGLL
jgi:hypothetical protein